MVVLQENRRKKSLKMGGASGRTANIGKGKNTKKGQAQASIKLRERGVSNIHRVGEAESTCRRRGIHAT